MQPFIHTSNPTRVIFGFGTIASVAAEVETLGRRRALVLATPQQEDAARALARQMGAVAAAVFAGATRVGRPNGVKAHASGCFL
jgi:maleylacetate reductase